MSWTLAAWLAVAEAGDDLFRLDPVFVSRFEPASPAAKPAAERLRVQLERALDGPFLLIDRRIVPKYEDYDAEIYLQSCPLGQIVGCSYVIGERAQASWVVTGEVADLGSGRLDVAVHFVDVADARVVFDMHAVLNPGDEGPFADGVSRVLSRTVAGDLAATDDRGPMVDDTAAWAARRALAAQLAESLEGLDLRIERDPIRAIDPPKLAERDLAELRDREDGPPWQALGLTELQYVRFHDSGLDLETWRERERGRMGRPFVAAAVGGGSHPFSQSFDVRRGLDPLSLEPLGVEQRFQLVSGGGLRTELEAGIGILPWFDASAFVAFRTLQYRIRFHTEKVGDPEPVGGFQDFTAAGTELGARATFAPFPQSSIRPTGSAGFATWRGKAIDQVIQVPSGVEPAPAPSLLIFEFAPGGELDAGKILTLFVRAPIGVVLVGNAPQVASLGESGAVEPPPDGSVPGTSVELIVGVRIRGPRLFGTGHREPTGLDEEP